MIDELNLTSIDSQAHLTISHVMVAAAAFAARHGYGDWTARRFVVALVMTDTLKDQTQWPTVLRKIAELQIESDASDLGVEL